MEKLEIRYSRKKLMLIILFCIVWVILTTYIIFSTEPYSTSMVIKTIALLINSFVLYVGCLQAKLLLENAPVLTLSSVGMDVNLNGKISTFYWGQIKNLTIEKVRAGNRGKTDILNITSDTCLQKVPLAPLEKSVAEIKELLSKFSGKTVA